MHHGIKVFTKIFLKCAIFKNIANVIVHKSDNHELTIHPSAFNFIIICWSHYDCMTAKQKVKYFKSAENQNELEQINEFISSPKINATFANGRLPLLKDCLLYSLNEL